MKIQQRNYLGLRFDPDTQDKVYALQEKTINLDSDEAAKAQAKVEIRELLNDSNNVNYLMTAPSLAISSKIRIDEDKFDCRMFRGLRAGKKITILINDCLFYRYLITLDSILCMWVTTEPRIIDGVQHSYLTYTTFKINTERGYLSYPVDEPFEVVYFKSFIQQLIFLEFSELETVTLKPNMKVGTKKQGNYLNASNTNVIIVDSTWNKIMIRTGEFAVQGHLRLQPYGADREYKKLIYIKEFTKSGYTRNAKKELTN